MTGPQTVHVSRLTWWDYRGRGQAEHDGVLVELRVRPAVLPHIGRLAELVYAPGQGVREVQEEGQQRRDLQPGESAELLVWLIQMAEATRDACARRVPTKTEIRHGP